MSRVPPLLAISHPEERSLKMKKRRAIFVSLDLYYRYDLSATHPIRAAADGQLALAKREGVSGGQSGDLRRRF